MKVKELKDILNPYSTIFLNDRIYASPEDISERDGEREVTGIEAINGSIEITTEGKNYLISEVFPDGSTNFVEVVENEIDYTLEQYLKDCETYANPEWIEYVTTANLICEEYAE